MATGLELFHYGVKGMKWGVRKDDHKMNRIAGYKNTDATKAEKKQTDEEVKAYKKATTRSQRKQDIKDIHQSKADYVIDKARKNPKKLVALMEPDGITTILEGSQFIDALGKGASFNPMLAEVTDLEYEYEE